MADSIPPDVPLSHANNNSRSLLKNYISLAGIVIAAVAFANILFLFLIDIFSAHPNPYIGVLAYMVMPGLLILGLTLVPLGMLHERNRRRRGAPTLIPRFPRIDLNDPSQRSKIAFTFAFGVIFVMLSAVGSYRAYEYTDSVQFCGQLCHSVMHPEFTAYQLSPHARVTCVECHVGAGASWYVKSKLSGARQVFKTAFNTFPRPIPTPVHDLRPAQETCEQCHWPKKFWGAQLKEINHFSYDEKNTPRSISLLIKTGGGDPTKGVAEGIHWHMNIANVITYVSDDKRQNIPWVRVQNQQGKVTEYKSADFKMTPEELEKATKKRMDCVDCHNRPTHIYVPPDRSVDDSLFAKRISPDLPYIKQQGVTVLSAGYKTTDEAMQAISRDILKFYKENYPQVFDSRRAELDKTIAELQQIFRTTTFPEMNLDWKTHQNNVGHFYYQGCFRCHDGQHTNSEGKAISKNCNACHVILQQREAEVTLAGSTNPPDFKHPIDLGDMGAVNCSDCHTGAAQ